LIAYEIPLGLGILGVILYSGSLDLERIISDQATTGVWNAFTQPLGFIVFMVASFAESARLPFDLPECEQELIGGYHTEYAGMKLLLFLIAEFLHMVVSAFLIVILFFGGWHLWGVTGTGDEVTWIQAIARIAVLVAKIMVVIVFFMMVRWSWPRFRFDQLMSLAWKVMLPLGLLNLTAVAVISEYMQTSTEPVSPWLVIGCGWAVLLVGWVGASLAAPLHDDNRPKLNTREFDVEEELATGAKS
jgi:NADH-quinone oxidoreductase subunit H